MEGLETLLLFVVTIPLLPISVWILVMSVNCTEEAEAHFPDSRLIKDTRAMLAAAGQLGKLARNSLMAMVLMMPRLYVRKGLVLASEVEAFPRKLKRLLVISWAAGYVVFASMLAFWAYTQYLK